MIKILVVIQITIRPWWGQKYPERGLVVPCQGDWAQTRRLTDSDLQLGAYVFGSICLRVVMSLLVGDLHPLTALVGC